MLHNFITYSYFPRFRCWVYPIIMFLKYWCKLVQSTVFPKNAVKSKTCPSNTKKIRSNTVKNTDIGQNYVWVFWGYPYFHRKKGHCRSNLGGYFLKSPYFYGPPYYTVSGALWKDITVFDLEFWKCGGTHPDGFIWLFETVPIWLPGVDSNHEPYS